MPTTIIGFCVPCCTTPTTTTTTTGTTGTGTTTTLEGCEDCCDTFPDSWLVDGAFPDSENCDITGCEGVDGACVPATPEDPCRWNLVVSPCEYEILIEVQRFAGGCELRFFLGSQAVWRKTITGGNCNTSHTLGPIEFLNSENENCDWPENITLTPGCLGGFAFLKWDEDERLFI